MTTYIYNMGLRFKQVAGHSPHHIALRFADGQAMSYEALDARSDEIATHLIRAGAGTNRVVAIFADKHPVTYATMLACLKIGAAYVVLDTKGPEARREKILQQCRPAVFVSQTKDASWPQAVTLSFDDLASPADPLNPKIISAVCGTSPAYLMYTSGSTGFPKGVTISHASLLNFCDWARDTFDITPQDCVSGANALYFDNSVFDTAASLFNGACLVPMTREALQNPRQLVQQAALCSVWFSVPSLLIYLATMRALEPAHWPNMRAIIFGGEGYAKAELKKLYQMFSRQATLWNVYGPTECTCICSAYAISKEDFTDMAQLAPLGKMAPNFSALVMNDDGTTPVADGEVGELYLGGSQLALGYYNDPERTHASFVPDPLHQAVRQLYYRTGDLVIRNAHNGDYHFAGRKDNQIKHMGYRIELEEIESALCSFAEVAQAAVIYHKHAAHGGQIIAFVTSPGGFEPDAIERRLRAMLPSYMIPHETLLMAELPKNANGKVDRKALAAMRKEAANA